MPPPTDLPQAGPSVVVWGLRRYAWLVVLTAAVTAAVALLVSQTAGSQYEARSLVVAQKLTISPLSLPRFAEAVFESGSLESKVSANAAFSDLPKPLIPDQLDVEVAKDSVVINVVARAPSADQAKLLADTATTMYVAELNAPGTGVGVFEVQADAPLPEAPAGSALPAPLAGVFGLLAGGILGIGLVLLYLVITRPIIDARGVEDVTGLPLLAIVNIPKRASSGDGTPLPIRGTPALVRRLSRPGPARVTVLSQESDDKLRERLVEGLIKESRRSIEPLTIVDGSSAATLGSALGVKPGAGKSGADAPTIYATKTPLGKADAAESILLTAHVGVHTSRLRRWANTFPEHETSGVVLLNRRK